MQKNIYKWVSESSARYGEKVAIVSGKHSMNYKELEEKVNVLVDYLIGAY